MLYVRIVWLLAFCVICYDSKAQRHFTVPELIRLAHMEWKKIDSAALQRGFNMTFTHVYYEGKHSDFMQINKPVAEGAWAVKRELYYSHYNFKTHLARDLMYFTTDYKELEAMLDWLEANGYKEYQPPVLNLHYYSKGDHQLTIDGERVENSETGEVVTYYFRMKTEVKKY